MFMPHILYDNVCLSIYESEFYSFNTLAYDLPMSNLRDRIHSELKKRGWTVSYLAELSKVPQPTIQRFLKGTHGEPRSSTIQKIAKGFGMTEAQLRGFDDTKQPVKIEPTYTLGGFDLWDENTPLDDDEVALPFFREVELSAGPGICEVQENHGLKLRFAKSTLKKQGVQFEYAACVTVSGNSMEPVLPDGCVVGIDTGNKTVKNGDWYAINHNGHLRVKVLYTLPAGGYRLRSFNIDEYPDETVQFEDIVILGRVFWWSGLR